MVAASSVGTTGGCIDRVGVDASQRPQGSVTSRLQVVSICSLRGMQHSLSHRGRWGTFIGSRGNMGTSASTPAHLALIAGPLAARTLSVPGAIPSPATLQRQPCRTAVLHRQQTPNTMLSTRPAVSQPTAHSVVCVSPDLLARFHQGPLCDTTSRHCLL